METLNLTDAASFLKMSSEVLRRQAKLGKIPGRKPGKRWIFIKEHLADWVSGRYPDPGRELRVIDSRNQPIESIKQCQSTSAKTRGGYNSPHQMDAEYNNLLGLK
ncbi:MAG: helix-turn-helix domain-containing protein [Methylobacter sp.]